MKRYLLVIVFSTLVLVSGYTLAKWVGRFYCGTSCSFEAPFASGDAYTFILSEVNKHVSSWTDGSGNPNTVTLCNGSKCATFKYIKLSGQFQYTGYYYSNWSGQDAPPSGGGGSGGGGGGGGGGANPPSGCYGNCEGTVVVGSPETVSQ